MEDSGSDGRATRVEEEVSSVLEQAKELQDLAASFISKSSKEEHSIRQRALALDSSIRKLRSSIDSLVADKLVDSKLAEKVLPSTFVLIR